MNSDFGSVFRLSALEAEKLIKGKAFYIVLLVLIGFGGLVATNNRSGDFVDQEQIMRQELAESLTQLEQGQFGSVTVFFPNGSSSGPPPGFDPINKPLRDEQGDLITENIEYYKQLYTAYVEQAISDITQAGTDPLTIVMGQTSTQVATMIPMLAVALAIGLYTGEFRGGYRLMISRGVKRGNLMSAKLLTTLGLSLVMATVFTLVMLLGSLGAVTGLETTISMSQVYNIFGIALLMFIAYMLVGGVIGTMLGSAGSGMAIGLVLAFISSSFFFNLTPKDDFFLAFISPFTVGYNFNSLMYYIWRAGEESDRYRAVIPSIAVLITFASVYASVIYGVFSKKQLRG